MRPITRAVLFALLVALATGCRSTEPARDPYPYKGPLLDPRGNPVEEPQWK